MADNKPDSGKTSAQQSAPGNRMKEPWERQPCGLCRAAKSAKRCNGHGGGGGGSGSGSSNEDTDKKTDQAEAKTPSSAFNFAIENDKEAGLTFTLQCSPYLLLSEEQRNELKIIDNVLKELEDFKRENKIDADCITITKDKNGNILSLSITLPTAALNAEFIQRLANKNLLQNQNLAQTKESAANQKGKHTLNLTPLATIFSPSLKRNKEEQKEKEIEKPNASKEQKKPSSIRPKGPRDKLKPKGWE